MSNTKKPSATGLGLSIVKCSVELIKGTVSFDITLGLTTFKIILPLTQQTENDQHH
ncbi:MAG: hypothetical protein ABIN91_04120 [Mucilaginibacter sp.]|uniref:hypothetical protein n=1 Tax=Mucilaginibacter sp. TaxID=1882438 RepID=UPI0032675773